MVLRPLVFVNRLEVSDGLPANLVLEVYAAESSGVDSLWSELDFKYITAFL